MVASEKSKEMNRRLDEAAHYLEHALSGRPEVAVVLGSGLGGLSEYMDGAGCIDYMEIPAWPKASAMVEGHAGMLHHGKIGDRQVAVLAGRFHLYQGHSIEDVVFPMRVLGQLGVRLLVVTNAAGGVNPDLAPGDLMLIRDHVGLQGISPLEGDLPVGTPERFVDMTEAYDRELSDRMREVASTQGLKLAEGVYASMRGPQYETPAEVRMLRALGVDAVGMSTVPEVIAARHMGMRVVGVSCITNAAAGVTVNRLSHEEVLQVGSTSGSFLARLIYRFLDTLRVI
jgi:purine-nucleoside phosphorylase